MTEQYQQQIEIAQKYKEAGEFKEAEKSYRLALKDAPPHEMQDIIEQIRQMKEKSSAMPKPDKLKQKPEETGFILYKNTFEDVIGYKVQKRLMKEFIEIPLKYADKYAQRRMSMSTGILLYGAPGTGKTFLVKGLSGELKLHMRDVFISDIKGRLVGDSEKNMRKVFDDARKVQPCIVFFDEIDALGGDREGGTDTAVKEGKDMVNEFLKQLSNLHDDKEVAVFVIGATNLPWLLDQAIKRSGRLEHHIYMRPPNFWDRKKILQYYLQMEGVQLKVNWNLISTATIRYSQADIEKVCTAVKRRTLNKNLITTHDIQKVLKDKNIGGSSLDEWILKAKTTYLKKSKEVVHKTGFLGLRRQKEKIEEQGVLSEEELKIYKPLINNIRSYVRWWTISSILRFLARGF